MCNAFWQHALFVRGQSFSVKPFDRSRNGCQVIRLGRGETIFVGLPGRHSLSPRVSHSRPPVFSCAHYFQAPLLPSATIFFFPHRYPAGGAGVLPYMGYIGMCRCEGYGFQAVYSRIGYINQSVWV